MFFKLFLRANHKADCLGGFMAKPHEKGIFAVLAVGFEPLHKTVLYRKDTELFHGSLLVLTSKNRQGVFQ